uniref:Leucine-rich repeat protein SHOC-2 n=1 Tax=Salmo trutta TaxID=8032 RepID=A0A673ZM93_SALTR
NSRSSSGVLCWICPKHNALYSGHKVNFFKREKEEPAAVPYGLLKTTRKSRQLNLSWPRVTEVPQSVWRLNLDTPEEAKQNLSFGADVRWWDQTDLTKLLLSSNMLEVLSEDFDVYDDPLTFYPVFCFPVVHDDQLTSLPKSIGELENLQKLSLRYGRIFHILLENVWKRLQLQQNPLEELPEGVGQLTNVDDIDLSNNQLTAVPDSLGNLNHLLKNLPSGIIHNILYECLHRLDCTHNQLESIPPVLSQMVSLDQLCLRQNKLLFLPELPSSRLKIRILMELHVGTHLIEVEAKHVKHLNTRSELELRDNKVKSVPEEITLLQGLECLDLINNDISSLPAALGLMLRLNILTLEGNPLRHIHGDLLTLRTTSHYLLERIQMATEMSLTLLSQAKINVHAIKTLKILDYTDKQAVCVPDDLFNAVDSEPIASVNFSKNQLAAVDVIIVIYTCNELY